MKSADRSLLHYSQNERKNIVQKIEELTCRPYREFDYFAAEWLRMFGSDAVRLYDGDPAVKRVILPQKPVEEIYLPRNDYDDYGSGDEEDDPEYRQMQERRGYDSGDTSEYEFLSDIEDNAAHSPESRQAIRHLNREASAMITDIFRHDDIELQERAVMIVVVSLRYYIRGIIARFGKYTENDRQDYLGIAFMVIYDALPAYDASHGMLTTYLDGRIRKAFIEQRANEQLSSRYNESMQQLIKQCREWAAVNLRNPNPTPETMYEIATKIFKKKQIKLQSIINAMNWQRTLVSSDEDENFANRVKSQLGDPEKEYERKALAEQVHQEIQKLPPIEKCVMECIMEYQMTKEKLTLPPDSKLAKMVRRYFPSVTDTLVKRAEINAINTMSSWYGEPARKKKESSTVSGMETSAFFEEEAKTIQDCMDEIEDLDSFFEIIE